MQLRGIIFDLDGVLCSTDEYHYQAWKMLADKIQTPFDRIINQRLRGVSRMDSLDIILEQYHGPALSLKKKQELADWKNEQYRILLEQMTPEDLTPQVMDTLNALREKGYLLAIGSSSKNASFILERIGLKNFFDAQSDGNNISRSKPDPEVFLKAATFLNLSPDQCLVVEDAVAGAQAGHNGGFLVACVGNAAQEGVGDYNLKDFSQLLTVTNELDQACRGRKEG